MVAFMSNRRPTARVWIVAAFVVLALFLTFGRYQSVILDRTGLAHTSPIYTPSSPLREIQIEFWRKLQAILYAHAPQISSPVRVIDEDLMIGFEAKDQIRPDLLYMRSDYVDVMQDAHRGLIADIRSGTQDGKGDLKLVYDAGTRGIVTTAGGNYLVVFVISLRMLRRTGSTLPVEVFLADSNEFEPYICDTVLPTLNARCVVLADIFNALPGDGINEIGHYQYKIFSILFSSFEEVLFLDADCFPVHDPKLLFESEPFTSTGMVLWPDFWYMSESPAYFAIASQSMPSLGQRAGIEAGEILYSKPKHEQSLMLAAFYNMYGPSHYYPLLSQGAPGEGDKETFGWAATALGEPIYHVREKVRAIGRNWAEGTFEGSAMVQYDPRGDYLKANGNQSAGSSPTPFFVHANYPKFNPATIFQEEVDGLHSPTRHSNGSMQRAWTQPSEAIGDFGFDFEKGFWEEVKWTACQLENKFESWAGLQGVCSNAQQYWDTVFGETLQTG